MNEIEIHQREGSEDTETHLQENIEKFGGDALFLLKLMLRGEILTAKDVVKNYDIHDRRLRDLEISGKCEKRWVLKENGKRSHVEYFVTTPSLPTKSEIIAKADAIIRTMKDIPKRLETVFTLDDNPPSFQQTKLFE